MWFESDYFGSYVTYIQLLMAIWTAKVRSFQALPPYKTKIKTNKNNNLICATSVYADTNLINFKASAFRTAFYSTFTLLTCCKYECKKWPKEEVLFSYFLWLVKMILPSPFAKKLQNQCICGRIHYYFRKQRAAVISVLLRMWSHFVVVNCSHRRLIAFALH